MHAYPKRLIEVDLPIKRISAHARREKSIRHGHISTLHIWWARRPLAACRAVYVRCFLARSCGPALPRIPFGSESRHCDAVAGQQIISGKSVKESYQRGSSLFQKYPERLNDNERASWCASRFHCRLCELGQFDCSGISRHQPCLTQAAHEALGGAPGTRPLVVDPFAGGGSIPLEALRVGADAFASDLNPVPVLLNKVILEYIPNTARRLADEVRRWGRMD